MPASIESRTDGDKAQWSFMCLHKDIAGREGPVIRRSCVTARQHARTSLVIMGWIGRSSGGAQSIKPPFGSCCRCFSGSYVIAISIVMARKEFISDMCARLYGLHSIE